MANVSHIYSWNPNSEGAILLSKEMGIKRIRHGEKSLFKGGPKKVVINWGSSQLPPEVMKSRVLNGPTQVGIASNKLSFFRAVDKKVSIPPWTTDEQQALKWVTQDRVVVCARQVLQGHSAEGLVLMDRDHPETFVKAPLYTQYVPKADEYRIHVVGGAVTDIQRKALRTDFADVNPGVKPNWKVRNHANGFIYVRNNVIAPECVLQEAIKAVDVCGLDFGAVDVIYNQKSNKGYVLEINTAPGIEGTSIVNYVAAFRDMK